MYVELSAHLKQPFLIYFISMQYMLMMQYNYAFSPFDVVRKRSPPHLGIVFLVPPNSADLMVSSHLAAMCMDSSRSQDSNATTPSIDLDEADAEITGDSQARDDEEASLSAPSSPTIKRSLHRRQRSQSLDDITLEDTSKLLSPERGPAVILSQDENNAVMNPLFKGIGSDESGSESEFDMFETVEENERSRMPSKLKDTSVIPLLHVVEDPKVSDDEEDESRGVGEGWGAGKLSKLKGRLLMKVKSSMPRPHSRSPVPASDSINTSTGHTSPKPNTLPVASSNGYKGDATVNSSSGGGGGAQWVDAVKQRFRVSSPGLWNKMIRRTSPSAATPGSGEEDTVKLEEARKRSKSRLVFI